MTMAAVLVAASLTPMVGQAQTTHSSAFALSVSAQPLSLALNELARQARVELIATPELLKGKSAPALSGQFTLHQALERMLAGSGLGADIEGRNVVIRRLGVTGPASTLPEVLVSADAIPNPVERVYDRASMDSTPEGNRDLVALIADHPGVRLNPTIGGNGNRGSLAPESISIHGQSPYQNQFLVDGMGGTNSLNPQVSTPGLQVGRVPGFSQAYNLDTELLDSVRVYDSMVPVEFGHFQGGVIDARIKTPIGSNTVNVQRSFNSSNLTRQRMPEGVLENWKNGTPGYAAIWKKHFTSMQGDFRITEDSTALFSFSRRESLIERQAKVLDRSVTFPNGKSTLLEKSDEKDQVDNFFAKLYTNWGAGTHSSLLLKYADRQEDLVSNSFADTAWTNQQKAMGVAFDITRQLDSGRLKLKLGVDQLNARRDSSNDELTVQMFADKSLSTYTWGGFGAESLEQRQYAAKLRMDWDSIAHGSVQHKLYAGADLQSLDARFVRHQDAYANNQTLLINGAQKITTRTKYSAGTVGIDLNSLSLYLADQMQWGHWHWMTSLRADHDSFFGNTNLAPRTRLDWDAWGDGSTWLSLGWGRYYGIDMLGYALEQGKSRMVTYEIQKGIFVNRPGTSVARSFEGVKTPYSDEWAFRLTQKLGSRLEASLQLVHRDSKDELTQEGSSAAGYRYTNGGFGKADSAILSLRSLRAWPALAADWSGRLDLGWERRNRNHDSTLGWEAEGLAPDDIVEFNGGQIQRKDMPSREFNLPRKLTMGINARWSQVGITWGNRLEWKSSRSAMAYLGTSKGVERYATQRLPSYMTWDTTLAYAPSQFPGLSLNIDVMNVLNKITPLTIGMPAAANNIRYQTGREIWLSARYQF